MLTKLKSLFKTSSPSPPVAKPERDSVGERRHGDEHLKQGRLDAAIACYRRALSVDANDVDTLVSMGFALSEQKEFAEAERILRHALAIDPSIADAHYILGTIARNQGNVSGAIEHYSEAIRHKPDFEFAYRDLLTALAEGGQLDRTKEVLLSAIAAFPHSAEFLFYLGNVLADDGDYDGAIARYGNALAIEAGSAQIHKRLGDALSRRGDLAEAVASYRKAVWFDPEAADAHIGLADALEKRDDIDAAIAACQRVAALESNNASVQIRLGTLYQRRGRLDDAISSFQRACLLAPENADAHQYLGNALLDRGATQQAVACFEEVVKLNPESPVKHLISGLSGGDSERAPSEYVRLLFDQYASKFDSHLVGALSYSVPEKLAELLRPYHGATPATWAILDLGCGTGLSGAAVAPFASEMVGVDLSERMLDKARERNLYQRLVQLDLLTMMRAEPSCRYDAVIAADVFVYIGKLDELVVEAQRLLRPGGLFAFSVESLEALRADGVAAEDRDYRLNLTGRYAHSLDYLNTMAAAGGFEVRTTTEMQSRIDKGKPMRGYLVVWRRPQAARAEAGSGRGSA
jgi:predicted TPR repeat methyltransferase